MGVFYEKKQEELKHLEALKRFIQEIAMESNSIKEESLFITQSNLLLKSPEQVLDKINILESDNLFQVRQVEEIESELELLKSTNSTLEKQITLKNEELLIKIKTAEKQKENLLAKLKNISKDSKEELIIDEKTLGEIHDKLVEIVNLTKAPITGNLSDLEMLEIIENSLKEQLVKRSMIDEEIAKKMEREADKIRRTDQIEKIKEKEMKKRMEINEKLQLRKNKNVKKIGRVGMPRSKIAEKTIVTEEPTIPQDILDRIEFLDEIINK